MELKVDADDWSKVSEADRRRIKEIADAFFKEKHTIVPQAGLEKKVEGAENFLCKSACNIAEAAAVAACATFTGPALAACIAAAHAAGEYCRSRC